MHISVHDFIEIPGLDLFNLGFYKSLVGRCITPSQLKQSPAAVSKTVAGDFMAHPFVTFSLLPNTPSRFFTKSVSSRHKYIAFGGISLRSTFVPPLRPYGHGSENPGVNSSR